MGFAGSKHIAVEVEKHDLDLATTKREGWQGEETYNENKSGAPY